MEALLALFIGVMTGAGVYLLLRARTFDVVLGMTLLSLQLAVQIPAARFGIVKGAVEESE